MAFGKLKRTDLDPEFINYIEEKWKKYESAVKRKKPHLAYRYRVAYDIALAEYDARVARDKGPKLTEKF